tara:strand:+ start:5492 stop:5713 length:222 start_codon:yes stop_codon:yes gene_type:complete
MRIMQVVELQLLTNKEKIEYMLEETLNNSNLDVDDKINKVVELVRKQTENINSIQLWASYVNGATNKEDKKEK